MRVMLFKGNSSRLELLIEKIQANKENQDVIDQHIQGLTVFKNNCLFALVFFCNGLNVFDMRLHVVVIKYGYVLHSHTVQS